MERLFNLAYEKLDVQITTRSGNLSMRCIFFLPLFSDNAIEICNYSMVMVSHAITIEKFIQKSCNKSKYPITDFHTASNPQIDADVEKANEARRNRIDSLFHQAREKIIPLVQANNTWSFFCLARLFSVWNKEEECKEWLSKSKDEFRRATKWQLLYFENVKNSQWYIELKSSL